MKKESKILIGLGFIIILILIFWFYYTNFNSKYSTTIYASCGNTPNLMSDFDNCLEYRMPISSCPLNALKEEKCPGVFDRDKCRNNCGNICTNLGLNYFSSENSGTVYNPHYFSDFNTDTGFLDCFCECI